MTSNTRLSVRINPENPNHHLWNNHGTWFIHYVVHPTPFTKERIRHSLHTKSLDEARQKRDALLAQNGLSTENNSFVQAPAAPLDSVLTPTECVRSSSRKSSQPTSSTSCVCGTAA